MEKRWRRVFIWSLAIFTVDGFVGIVLKDILAAETVRLWLQVDAVVLNLSTVGWFIALHKTCPISIASRRWRQVHLAASGLILLLALPLPYALFRLLCGGREINRLAATGALIFVAYVFAMLSWSWRQQSRRLQELDRQQAKLIKEILTTAEDARVSIRILRGDDINKPN